MSDFVFSFLEDQFRDIYLDCARMDKNLIEGDGVESILIAGRIGEKVTKAIFAFEGIKENEDNQYRRVEKLVNANILPNNIKNDLSELRRLRNNVYHNTLNSDGSGGFSSYNAPNYVQSGGLRDYKTGFNEVKDYSKITNNASNSNLNSNSNNTKNDFGSELTAAREAHKLVFNICVWFYVNYSGDKEFIRPKYKLSRRTQDADFLIRLKSAINDGTDFIKLRQNNPNNEVIQILNEVYVKKAPEEPKEDSVYGISNKNIKIRQPGVPYSKCLGVSYDDDVFMWHAQHGDKDLGLFQSSKEAFEAREIYISSIPMPPKVKGHYSKARGISFSKIQKLWTASVKGHIISYYATEEEAIKARQKYLKEHDLVDVKVKGGFKTISLEEKAKLEEKARKKKENPKYKEDIKTISATSSLKNELKKDEAKKIKENLNKHDSSDSVSSSSSDSKVGSSLGSKSVSSLDSKVASSSGSVETKTNQTKLSYYDVFKGEKDSKEDENKKVKIVNGSKVKSESAKKVKVSGGNRVSKKHKSKNNSNVKSNKKSKSSAINKKKSSKYEGVFYEEGLFMWSAEVDGKHLGLFASEKEAYEKREEYIRNKSNN